MTRTDRGQVRNLTQEVSTPPLLPPPSLLLYSLALFTFNILKLFFIPVCFSSSSLPSLWLLFILFIPLLLFRSSQTSPWQGRIVLSVCGCVCTNQVLCYAFQILLSDRISWRYRRRPRNSSARKQRGHRLSRRDIHQFSTNIPSRKNNISTSLIPAVLRLYRQKYSIHI